MANEIANLGISVPTDGLNKGKVALDALVPAAAAAASAASKVEKAFDGAGQAADNAAKKVAGKTKADLAAAAGATEFDAATRAATGALNAEAAAAGVAATAAGKAGNAASSAAAGMDRIGKAADNAAGRIKNLGTSANDNLSAVQATPANIAAQFQDIGVTAAAGMNPMLIALQQGTQLSAAFSGGLGNIGAALKQVFSPMSILTIAAVALIAYLVQMAMAFFNTGDAASKTSDALDKVKFASDAVTDSQSILGKVFDLTTGKLKTQNAEMLASARIQLMVARVKARTEAIDANSTINKATQTATFSWSNLSDANILGKTSAQNRAEGRNGLGWAYGPEVGILKKFQAATMTGDSKKIGAAMTEATSGLDVLARKGTITTARFAELGQAINNSVISAGKMSDLDKEINLYDQGRVGSDLVTPKKTRATRTAAPKTDPFQDILTGADNKIASLKAENDLIGKQGDALTAAKFMQDLLNQANAKDLKLTDAQTLALKGRADEMLRLTKEGDRKTLMSDLTTGSLARVTAIQAETDMIGKYGEALYFAQAQAELTAAAVAKGFDPTKDLGVASAINNGAAGIAEAKAAQDSAKWMEQYKVGAAATTKSLQDQIAVRGLYGEQLRAEELYLKAVANAKASNIPLDTEALRVIRETTAEQAKLATSIDRVAKAQDFLKSTSKSFFSDFYSGVKEGKTLWDSFADAISNVADKLMDKVFDALVNMAFDSIAPGSSSFLNALFSAKGNTFNGGGAMAFADGGAFSNSVVNSPTAFAFGKSGSNLGVMGEAGPEAVMPLQRGPDGSLGVQMYGGRASGGGSLNVAVSNYNTLSGAVSSKDIVALNQQTAAQTAQQMRREIPAIIKQYQRDGALA